MFLGPARVQKLVTQTGTEAQPLPTGGDSVNFLYPSFFVTVKLEYYIGFEGVGGWVGE